MKCDQCSKDLLGTPSKNPRTKLVRIKPVVTTVEGPDGMSSWVVAFSAFLINFIMAGLSRMSGILFVAFIEMFQIDRKGASMPFSVRSSTMNLLGPVVGVLGQKYGVRLVSIAGGVVSTLSAAACFFFDDITWITVIWGGFNGAGTALVTTLTTVMIAQYFDEYRTTASGLSFSGACVGSFIFPPLMEYLLHVYGLGGSFLIVAGIIMHTIPAAMILRKPVWVKKANKLAKEKDEEKTEKKKTEPIKVDANLSNDVELGFLRANSNAVFSLLSMDIKTKKDDVPEIPSKDDVLREVEDIYTYVEQNTVSLTLSAVPPKLQLLCETPPVSSKNRSVLTSWRSHSDDKQVTQPLIPKDKAPESKPFVLPKLNLLRDKGENQVVSPFEEQALYRKVFKELRKLLKIHESVKKQNVSVHPKPGFKVPPAQAQKAAKSKDANGIWTNIKNSMRLHANPLFLLVALCRAVHFTAFIPVVTIIVDYAMDKGFMEEDGKYVICALSVGDLVGRLGLGWVTDRGIVSMPNYMLIVMIVQGLFTAMLPITNTLITFLPAVAVYAMLQGSVFVRHSVLLCNYMRKDEQSLASGCVNFFAGLLGFAVPAYVGFFRDTMGSYDGIFYVNGIVGAAAGLLWAFEPIFLKWSGPKKFVSIDEQKV